jgi:hypothetical protein
MGFRAICFRALGFMAIGFRVIALALCYLNFGLQILGF